VQFVRSIEPAPDSSQTLFVRHGHRVLPNLTGPTYYEADTLGFYLELYNLVKLTQQPYYAKVTLIPASGGKKSQAFQRVYKPRQPQELAVLNGWFDIRNLSSNTYILEVELLTNDNVLLSTIRRKFFVVSSVEPFEIAASEAEYDLIFGYPEEELTRYIQAMGYISTEGEETMVNALQTYDDKKKYFVGFWTKRAQAFDRPMQQVWEDYRLRIEYANDKFRSARLAGWRSPRGRIFLTYGPPDDLQDFQNEQNLFPYQIWTYNVLRGQGGVFFVFFDRDLVSGDFELLHSTLIGEVFNANWRARLMRTRNAPDDFSITAPQGNDPFAFPDDKTMPGIGTGVR
jgi:GWxTD domain-containing protein